MEHITLSIPDEVYKEMKNHPEVKWSEGAQESVIRKTLLLKKAMKTKGGSGIYFRGGEVDALCDAMVERLYELGVISVAPNTVSKERILNIFLDPHMSRIQSKQTQAEFLYEALISEVKS